jgi:hypothetical protein
VKAYIADRSALPISKNGTKCKSRIDNDNVASEIATHLQGLGPWIRALDVVQYTAIPEVQRCLQIKNAISLATAKRWMAKMGYWWLKKPGGQYIDGHERSDVVYYHQTVFLPAWAELNRQTRAWTLDNQEIANEALASGQILVVSFHDVSTFYVNDQCIVWWVHKGETAVPHTKGEGALLMVADFVSADYAWLRSADGSKSTHVLFKAGKNWEGYFTNSDIVEHATAAMNILEQDYSDEDHVFVFDNATTHQKREEDALSATKMLKSS